MRTGVYENEPITAFKKHIGLYPGDLTHSPFNERFPFAFSLTDFRLYVDEQADPSRFVVGQHIRRFFPQRFGKIFQCGLFLAAEEQNGAPYCQ